MPSIRQIEAFYWSGQLGSFIAASERLNTTQSNISKRIQELEYTLGVELFDRAKRAIQLTAKGNELMRVSEDLLKVHLNLRQIGKASVSTQGPFRFGVTEAVALTWLPDFSALIRRTFDGMVPVAMVDTSQNLNALLLDRKIDLAIATDNNLDPSLICSPLVDAERVWVASPALVPDDRLISARELAAMPMIGHGANFSHSNFLGRYLLKKGFKPNIVISCTSMSALARMAMDGIGITYLHKDLVAGDLEAGRLKVVRTEVSIPSILYMTAHRNDAISLLAELVAAKAKEACDFTKARSLFPFPAPGRS